jgi:hypothetical protein
VSSILRPLTGLFYQCLLMDDLLWVVISGLVIDRENLRIRRAAYPSTILPFENPVDLKAACVSGYIVCTSEGAVSSWLRKDTSRLNSAKVHCHFWCFRFALPSPDLSKNLKIYKTIILPLVLYGCEPWFFALRTRRVKTLVKRRLRKIYY